MTLSRDLAWAAVTDAGNRSMRAAARSVWSEQDFNAAAREFNRLWPPENDIRDLRSSTKPVCGFWHPGPHCAVQGARDSRTADAQARGAQQRNKFVEVIVANLGTEGVSLCNPTER